MAGDLGAVRGTGGGRFRAWVWLAGLILLGLPGPLAARPSQAYLDLVARYAAGDRAEAVTALGAWTEQALNIEVKALTNLVVKGEPCDNCPPLPELFRTAVMLHTDRASFERGALSGSEQIALECRDGVHAAVAEQVAALLLGETKGRIFAERWYLAMALRAEGKACFREAIDWAERGLKWFPKDPQLLLAVGTAEEVLASLRFPYLVRAWQSGSQQREALALSVERRARLDRARRSLQEALVADPSLDEARLRLGRVQWAVGQKEAASASLQGVLAQSQDLRLLYLAHLFLGQIHEDAGRVPAAVAEYRAALALDPAAQVAAVALALALDLGGDVAASRQVLEAAVSRARRQSGDIYWSYVEPGPDRAEALLTALREETRR